MFKSKGFVLVESLFMFLVVLLISSLMIQIVFVHYQMNDFMYSNNSVEKVKEVYES